LETARIIWLILNYTASGFINVSCVYRADEKNIFAIIISTEESEDLAGSQSARRAIAEAKQRSQRPVIGWVTKIYYLELLRASEGTWSRWSRLHLQSFVPTVSRRVEVRQAAGHKKDCRIFITP
jgi:hypothetical protein